jgi:hypothetical protein
MRKTFILFAAVFSVAVLGAFTTKFHSVRLPMATIVEDGSCVRTELPQACGIAGSTVCTISGVTYYLITKPCSQAIVYNP